MIPGVERKTVAIVGRAASLLGSGSGAAIDACEVVVRVNWMLPYAAPVEDVGARTDVVYRCAGCQAQDDAAVVAGVAVVRVSTKLRRDLAKSSAWSHKVHRPTTGVVALYDALLSGASCVHAFGFDVYSSGYTEPVPPPTGTKTFAWTHEKKQDRALLRALLDDPRFVPDSVLRRSL